VTVITTSALRSASSRSGTKKPSSIASSRRIGSLSTTDTTEYALRKFAATPLPQAPYPNTVTRLPFVDLFVRRMNDSSTL